MHLLVSLSAGGCADNGDESALFDLPYPLEAAAVRVRVHGKGNLGAKPRSAAIADILSSIKERRA